MKMKDSGAGRYRPVKCSIFEQKHAWGHHEACSRSQRIYPYSLRWLSLSYRVLDLTGVSAFVAICRKRWWGKWQSGANAIPGIQWGNVLCGASPIFSWCAHKWLYHIKLRWLGSLAILNDSGIKLSLQPHVKRTLIAEASKLCGVPDFGSTICQMLNGGGDRSENGPRWTYNDLSIPDPYQFINIWHSFRLIIPPYDEFADKECVTIYAKPPQATICGSRYTPVMVLTDENAHGIHCTWHSWQNLWYLQGSVIQATIQRNFVSYSKEDNLSRGLIMMPPFLHLYFGYQRFPPCLTTTCNSSWCIKKSICTININLVSLNSAA